MRIMKISKNGAREITDDENKPRWQRPFQGLPHLRDPDQETEDYPGLVVHDGRVSGSITVGNSRLPLWTLIPDLVQSGFPSLAENWDDLHGLTAEKLSEFLYYLMEQRGEFGRLLCILADVERQAAEMEEREGLDAVSWWYHPEMSQRVCEALRRCLDSIEIEAI